ncbi:transposase [Rhodococcus sp. T7]|uniref:transposase n=1 Tax=Rhodococcus sp. T7 TaxID=627444 RepID=UPI001916DCEE|nr:transposase [Rhodococcus sp. T7]
MDLLPGRKRCVATPGGPCNLGAQRYDTGSASPILLETHVHRGPGLSTRPHPQRVRVLHDRRRYNTDKLIEFLTELRTHFAGEKVILIWDGLMAHRSKAMTAWLATQRDWLHVERLPAYAPELNPIEQVWGNMKSTELANLCPEILDQVRIATEAGLTRIGSNYDLCHSFLDHTGLSL